MGWRNAYGSGGDARSRSSRLRIAGRDAIVCPNSPHRLASIPDGPRKWIGRSNVASSRPSLATSMRRCQVPSASWPAVRVPWPRCHPNSASPSNEADANNHPAADSKTPCRWHEHHQRGPARRPTTSLSPSSAVRANRLGEFVGPSDCVSLPGVSLSVHPPAFRGSPCPLPRLIPLQDQTPPNRSACPAFPRCDQTPKCSSPYRDSPLSPHGRGSDQRKYPRIDPRPLCSPQLTDKFGRLRSLASSE